MSESPKKKMKILVPDSDEEEPSLPQDAHSDSEADTGSLQVAVNPIPNMPWAKTSSEMRRLGLGILDTFKVLICTKCFQPGSLMTVNEAIRHAMDHRPPGTRLPTMTTIRNIIHRYDVFPGDLNDIELPPPPIRAYPFLATETGSLCEICEEEDTEVICRSSSSQQKHYQTKHPKFVRDARWRNVDIQSFSPHRNRVSFQVAPPLPEELNQPEPLQPQWTSAQIADAYAADWKPLPPRPVTAGEDLKRTTPFLVFSGLQKVIEGWTEKKIQDLLLLLESPASNDPLRQIYDAAINQFKVDQAEFYLIPECHRRDVMRDDSKHDVPMTRLQTEQSQVLYSQSWASIIIFLARIQRRVIEDQETFGIVLTSKQTRWAERIWRQADSPTYDWPSLLFGCSHWLWRGDGPGDFMHLSRNKWCDISLIYAVGMCLRPTGLFHEPRECGHRLARLKYGIRYSLLAWAMDTQAAEGKSLEWLEEVIPKCLDRKQLCPFGEISNIVSLADRHSDSTTAPKVYWTRSDALTVGNGTHVKLSNWQTGVCEYVHDMREHWFSKVFRGIPLKVMGLEIGPTTEIHDDPEDTSENHSFVHDDRNSFHQNRFSLGTALLTHEMGGRMHDGLVDGKIQWNQEAVDEWLQDLDEGVRRLMASTHTLAGQPPRGVETSNLRVANTPGRPRNFLIMAPGSVVIFDQYNKTTATTGHDKPRMHCLPWILGEIFIAMQVLAIPFAGYLIGASSGLDARYVVETSLFPIAGREATPEDLSKELKRLFKHWVSSEGMGLRNYRQFTSSIENKLLPWMKRTEARRTTLGEVQAGHSRLTALIHYGVEAGRLAAVGDSDYLMFLGASLSWASLVLKESDFTERETEEIAFVKRLEQPSIDYGRLAVAVVAEMKKDAYFAPRRPGHGDDLEVGELEMGLLRVSSVDLSGNSDVSSREPSSTRTAGPHASSTSSERSVSITRTTSAQASPLEAPRPLPVPCPADIVDDRVPEVTKEHKDVLATFTGNPNAEWTSVEQATAFALVTSSGRRSLLVVLPTGAGKSLLFLGPALMERGLTVVIFPLRALLLDQLRNAERMGLPAHRWSHNLGDVSHGVVFVSVEQVSAEFGGWCLAQRQRGRLNRIAIDEGHVIIEAADYRAAMANMGKVLEVGVPLLILTATLPPSLEHELQTRLGISTMLRCLRVSTQRPNIIQHMCRYANQEKALQALVSHAKLYVGQLHPGEGLLICVRGRDDLEPIQKLLPGSRTYRSSDNDTEKTHYAAIAQAWLDGEFPLLIGTSAIGTGTHHARVRVVLHYGLPWSIQTLSQHTGRAGRDGEPGYGTVYHSGLNVPPPKFPAFSGWEAMKELATGTRCIRSVMSEFLDGAALRVTCFSGPYSLCGNCVNARSGQAVARTQKIWRPEETVIPTIRNLGRIPAQTADETPSQEQRRVIDARHRAIALAQPAAPVSPTVEEEARASVTRRIDRQVTMNKAALNGDLNYALHLLSKQWMLGRCGMCLVLNWEDCRHQTQNCNRYDCGDGALPTFHLEGQSMNRCCVGTPNLPYNNSICYFCYWPIRGHSGGREKRDRLTCEPRWQQKQMCWLMRLDPVIWEALKSYFELDDEHNKGPSYMRWLYTVSQQLEFDGYPATFINMHRVVLWYITIYRRVNFRSVGQDGR